MPKAGKHLMNKLIVSTKNLITAMKEKFFPSDFSAPRSMSVALVLSQKVHSCTKQSTKVSESEGYEHVFTIRQFCHVC